MLGLVDIWDPDWLASRYLSGADFQRAWEGGPVFGWINYLAERVGKVNSLPPGWRWSAERNGLQIFVHENGVPSKQIEADLTSYARLLQEIKR